MDCAFLTRTALFEGMDEKDAGAVLRCLDAREKEYSRGDMICRAGEPVESMGLVLTGSVNVEIDDLWGGRTILAHVGAGQLFAETYACIPGEPLMVNVEACERTVVLFISAARLLSSCESCCVYHSRLIQNLLRISAQKNLALSRRSLHTSAKSIRGRVLSYLSEQARRCGGRCFTIPFNRQQLADYLNVDRSALSGELGRMRRDGLLDYERNRFTLRQLPE
ncbi:MAG: Crp/Fnr family transcriptional regulator [Oscillospiraceae bacterium]|nr:Crp/Fnr family transcriptional regulator [Oscillospiraceae bacterium]